LPVGLLGVSTQDAYVLPLNLSGIAMHDCISNICPVCTPTLPWNQICKEFWKECNAGVQVMLLLA